MDFFRKNVVPNVRSACFYYLFDDCFVEIKLGALLVDPFIEEATTDAAVIDKVLVLASLPTPTKPSIFLVTTVRPLATRCS